MKPTQIAHNRPTRKGKWVTPEKYEEFSDVKVAVLCNWRSQDKKQGRKGPLPGSGKPVYRRFGKAIRYFLPDDPLDGVEGGTAA
jgi:hypothetical protein